MRPFSQMGILVTPACNSALPRAFSAMSGGFEAALEKENQYWGNWGLP